MLTRTINTPIYANNFDLTEEVTIEGGGIIGALTAFVFIHCVKDFDPSNIAIFERRRRPGTVNSDCFSNAATLHEGLLEDYKSTAVIEKMLKQSGLLRHLVENHLKEHPQRPLLKRGRGMLLAIGDTNIAELQARNAEIKAKGLFEFEEWDNDTIQKNEPKIMQGRDPNQRVKARAVPNAHAVDFGAIAESIIDDLPIEVNVYYQSPVISADYNAIEGNFAIKSTQGTVTSKTFISASSATSLHRAHHLNVGKHLSMAIIAGNFYHLREKYIHSIKLYLLNDPDKKLPFSTSHADESMRGKNTIIGPTTVPVFTFERGRHETVFKYLKTLGVKGAINAVKSLLGDMERVEYMTKQALYLLPFGLGNRLFLKFELSNIFPSITAEDLKRTRIKGGVRPQVLDNSTGELEFGTKNISDPSVPGFVANLTASPGASISAFLAIQNVIELSEHLGYEMDKEALKNYFGPHIDDLFDL